MTTIGNYFHTLRHLKAQQIYRRFWFNLSRPKLKNSLTPRLRYSSKTYMMPARRQPSLLAEGDFLFLNQVGSLAELGWNGGGASKLWRYNQHYFDDLNAFNARERKDWHIQLLIRWVEDNPPTSGVGWESYTISLRIVNWIKWHFAGNVLPANCVGSIAVQARWLCKRIEWHIMGNHLFANAKALVHAGLFFSGEEAGEWLSKGLNILAEELPEQLLEDGGNFELSPMYHAIFLEDLLDLINLAAVFPRKIPADQVSAWLVAATHMLRWLDILSHPDGEIAFFNDAAIGVAPSPKELAAYAQRLGINKTFMSNTWICNLINSGYIRLGSSSAVALLDVGPIGPDYLPAHAHADTLSFELSLFGLRVFVNGGTSTYEISTVRTCERSTAAHNTVEINGENSSEVWSGFRVARRAYPRELIIQERDDSIDVSCAHDGYCRLPGKPIHRRSWRFSESLLVVEDLIEGHFEYAYAYFHVHPDVQVNRLENSIWKLDLPRGKQVLIHIERGHGALIDSHYSPEFGQRLSAKCLKVGLGVGGSKIRISWSGECV